jgi:hypothetical protein
VPLNDTAIHTALDSLDEGATAGVKFVGIHTLTDPGTGSTANAGEATGGTPAYARLAATWGAAGSRVKSNTNTFTFDVPAGTYGFFTLWNAGTGNLAGNYQGYIPFGGASAIKGFFSVDTTLTNDQFLSPGHGMADGDRVMLFDVFGAALPTGVSEGTIYFVVSSAANTFKVSTTLAGAAVDLTAVGGGEGYFQRVIPETYGAQGQVTAAAAALVLDGTAL